MWRLDKGGESLERDLSSFNQITAQNGEKNVACEVKAFSQGKERTQLGNDLGINGD